MDVEKCIVCGSMIPEGLQVCPDCMEAGGKIGVFKERILDDLKSINGCNKIRNPCSL